MGLNQHPVVTRLAAALMLAWPFATAARAQTVDEIVARHVEARGPAAQWQAVRTLRMTGRAVAGPGREALVTREVKRPGRVRTEFTFQGITGVFAVDGKRGWQISPLTGVLDPRVMPLDDTLAGVAQSDLDDALLAARKQGAALDVVGREAVAGRDAFRVRVRSKTGAVQEYFVDAETFLTVRTVATRKVGARAVEVETMFGEYRSVGGLVFPHAIEMGSRTRPERLRIVVQTIEVNPSIDDSRFKAPSGTRR